VQALSGDHVGQQERTHKIPGAHDNVLDSARTSRICPESWKTRSSESRKLENLIFSVPRYAKPLLSKKDIIARASL